MWLKVLLGLSKYVVIVVQTRGKWEAKESIFLTVFEAVLHSELMANYIFFNFQKSNL